MKETCATCGGTGQVGYFQGVSRFLLSWEECLQCNGTGYRPAEDRNPPKHEKKKAAPNRKSARKKKSD